MLNGWFSVTVTASSAHTGSSSSPGEALSPVKAPVLSLAKAIAHDPIYRDSSMLPSYSAHNAELIEDLSFGPDKLVAVENLTTVGS